jgi:hypothetical protein
MIDRNFLDDIPDSHTVKKNSEYRPMEKPPKKLLEQVLEQVSDVIRLKHYSYKTEKIISIGLSAILYSIINDTLEKWAEKKLKNFTAVALSMWDSKSLI